MRTFTARDVEMRLSGCYVPHQDGTIVYVDRRANEEDIPSLVCFTPTGEEVFEQEELVFSSLPQGLSMADNTAIYIQRSPTRKWKAGLCLGVNSTATTMEGRATGKNRRDYLKELQQIKDNAYPKYHEAIDRSRDGEMVVPFSRKFAVKNGEELVYRQGHVIGVCNHDRFQLKGSKEFLIQSLQEILNGN